ncbi:HIT family protein [Halococcus thailandensis]|uniref:Hit family hydrolase, diadenosine tetraphosphate hydrolase n=1 Tax=Halococcus thailandensis JCM 13552 TaxID=1227457 RepID=M0N8Z4_9EURY|nr:HIT domain-containing protein [Halococcus thailandensis]EMA53564.1 hit family hydrolase, diadenosine tetraphosphate hydrolase [Halococcus thailandensis JCM 13552]
MDELFAPWRIDWVERDDDADGCPFCVLPDRDADRDSRIVARSEHAFCLLNNAPYNPGHAMVIPYRHTGVYGELTEAELLDLSRLTQRTLRAIETGLGPDGANTGMNLGDSAGGSIDDHLHRHVVPRWNGDTNFMPVIDETQVIVEAIDDTYDHLHAAFADQDDTRVDDPDDAVRIV